MKKCLWLAIALGLIAGPAMAADLPLIVSISTGQIERLPASDTLQLYASGSGFASINLGQGSAVSSPNNGDMWVTSSGLFYRANGTTYGPLVNFSLTSGNTGITLSPSPFTGGTATVTLNAGTNSAIGGLECDGTTDTCSGGIISVINMQFSTLVASESISAGALVSIWNSAGTAKVRNANATDNTKTPDGFVLAAYTNGQTATVYLPGQIITGLSSLTPGTVYFLSTTGGALTATAPSTAGNLLQPVGKSLSATTLLFQPQPGVTL